MTPQPAVEARVITAMLGEPGMLEVCNELELGDLSDYRYRAILTAIRELQETGTPVGILTVADAIAMRDMDRETHVSQSVGVWFLTEMLVDGRVAQNSEGPVLVLKNPPYRNPMLLEFDLYQLRRIARSNA